MEYLVFLVTAAVIICILFLFGKTDEKKRIRRFQKKRAELFGHPSEKTYADNRFQTLKQSADYRKKKAGQQNPDVFSIDDITWNDLDMDRIFRSVDFTVSSAGEDSLYGWLRMPVYEESVLLSRESHICFFDSHKEESLEYQTFMAKVGKTGKYTIYNYLDFLDTVSEQKCITDIMVDIAIILSLLAGIFIYAGFIYLFAALIVFNGYQYYTKKSKIEPYFMSLSYFVRILDAAGLVQNMSDAFQAEFQKETDEIKKLRAEFSSFTRGAALALDTTPATGAGDFARILISYINMIFHFDLMKFYSMLHIVKTRQDDMIKLMDLLGETEACLSIAYFRRQLNHYCVPVFHRDQKAKSMKAHGLFHPLITEPVKNDLIQERCMLLTGSNASGKSTFLKTVSVNALLAQSIHTVCANDYCAAFYDIYSSMALRDSLLEGESYFIVEIKSIKRIFDAAERSDRPILCTIDEILRGTNTAERIGAGTELLKSIADKNVLCLAATHDLELTSLLNNEYENYHFDENVQDKDIIFSYRLLKGPAKGRNAIRLMEAYGFQQELTKKAQSLAETLS